MMKIKISTLALTLLMALAGSSLKAQTQTFDWSFTGTIFPGFDITGSGTLTADNSGDVLSISGTMNDALGQGNLLITQSIPPTGQVFPGQVPLLNGTGITFSTTNGPTITEDWNIFLSNSIYVAVETNSSGFVASDGGPNSFTLTAVPESSTYALLGLGALALLIATRRRNA